LDKVFQELRDNIESFTKKELKTARRDLRRALEDVEDVLDIVDTAEHCKAGQGQRACGNRIPIHPMGKHFVPGGRL
jgi:hypothetical protein